VTYSLSRQLPSFNGSLYLTCKPELNNNFDDCINREVSQKMMDKYNCTAPFFPYYRNQSLDDMAIATALECKLNNFTKEQLVEFRDSYLGKDDPYSEELKTTLNEIKQKH
jgi:hypothetical protein